MNFLTGTASSLESVVNHQPSDYVIISPSDDVIIPPPDDVIIPPPERNTTVIPPNPELFHPPPPTYQNLVRYDIEVQVPSYEDVVAGGGRYTVLK